jgi:hypothetical protein
MCVEVRAPKRLGKVSTLVDEAREANDFHAWQWQIGDRDYFHRENRRAMSMEC